MKISYPVFKSLLALSLGTLGVCMSEFSIMAILPEGRQKSVGQHSRSRSFHFRLCSGRMRRRPAHRAGGALASLAKHSARSSCFFSSSETP